MAIRIKCDKDCLNCKYEDCIEDRISKEEWDAQDELDKEFLGKKSKIIDRREYQHQYYLKRKEELNAKSRQYFQDNKESIYLRTNARRRSKRFEAKRGASLCT